MKSQYIPISPKSPRSTSIPFSSTAHLMYYLSSVGCLMNQFPFPNWATDFQHFQLTNNQYIQFMSFIDEYSPLAMASKGLMIKLSCLPYQKENYFIDRRHPKDLEQLPKHIVMKILDQNLEGKRVLLYSKQWINKYYYSPLKFALKKHNKILYSKGKTTLISLVEE
jgi:hypothetical protein